MKRKITKQTAFESVARSLREFGYPDVTAQMVEDTWNAMKEGKKDADLPHGIVGRFAESQLSEHRNIIEQLP